MTRARGYSLIELALSMAIAGIIATAALSTFSVVNAQIVQMRSEAAVETKLQRALAGLVGDLQEVGGGALRPWHSLFVRPGTVATGGSDSILAFSVDSEFNGAPCPVVSYVGTVLKAGHVPDNPMPDPLHPTTHCCLKDGNLSGRFAAVTRKGDAVLVGLNATTINLAACTITAGTLFNPERIDAAHAWDGGTMTVVDAKWIAVDHTNHTLNAYMLEYLSPAPTVPGQVPPGMPIPIESETRTLARDVYDFQVANGYDKDANGVADETRDGVDDEWLGNASGEVTGETWLGDERSELTFSSNQFRMVEVGLVFGLRSKSGVKRSGVGVLDGPRYPSTASVRCMADHSRLFMRSGRARALLRNSGIYE